MRETVASQLPLVASSFDHPHVREFEEMGRVLEEAAEGGVEKGRKVRFDCTVTETRIHELVQRQ